MTQPTTLKATALASESNRAFARNAIGHDAVESATQVLRNEQQANKEIRRATYDAVDASYDILNFV
jgi:hypothetical protein